MLRRTAICAVVMLAFPSVLLPATEVRDRVRPILAGEMAVNPYDIIAVYRPPDQQTVAVYLGRPGQDIQVIFFRDPRTAATVFADIWTNNAIIKDPGADDGRPLTRMMMPGGQLSSATLIANTDRILAVVREPNHQYIRLFLDKPTAFAPVIEPGIDHGAVEKNYLEIRNIHEEADTVIAAYKACVLNH